MSLQHQDIYFKPLAKNGTVSKVQDELDLVHLLAKALRFINRFRIVLLSFAITGLSFGLYAYFTSSRQGPSKMLLHSNMLTNQEGIEIIDGWNELLAKGQGSTLAHIINCRESTVKKLTGIWA